MTPTIDELRALRDAPGAKHRNGTIDRMHAEFGEYRTHKAGGVPAKCGDCHYFEPKPTYMKTVAYYCWLFNLRVRHGLRRLDVGSESTDWRVRYPACRQFVQREGEVDE